MAPCSLIIAKNSDLTKKIENTDIVFTSHTIQTSSTAPYGWDISVTKDAYKSIAFNVIANNSANAFGVEDCVLGDSTFKAAGFSSSFKTIKFYITWIKNK